MSMVVGFDTDCHLLSRDIELDQAASQSPRTTSNV